MPSPDDLLAAAQSGDTRALSELVAQHRHGVYRYGLQVCRTTEDAVPGDALGGNASNQGVSGIGLVDRDLDVHHRP